MTGCCILQQRSNFIRNRYRYSGWTFKSSGMLSLSYLTLKMKALQSSEHQELLIQYSITYWIFSNTAVWTSTLWKSMALETSLSVYSYFSPLCEAHILKLENLTHYTYNLLDGRVINLSSKWDYSLLPWHRWGLSSSGLLYSICW